jgi:hypothetical protein
MGTLVMSGCRPNAREDTRIESYPVIGHLETVDKTVTIYSGPEQPVYSVLSASGQILADNLTADQVVARFPELTELVQQGYAELDARCYPSRED